jgi:hypothetical protein
MLSLDLPCYLKSLCTEQPTRGACYEQQQNSSKLVVAESLALYQRNEGLQSKDCLLIKITQKVSSFLPTFYEFIILSRKAIIYENRPQLVFGAKNYEPEA